MRTIQFLTIILILIAIPGISQTNSKHIYNHLLIQHFPKTKDNTDNTTKLFLDDRILSDSLFNQILRHSNYDSVEVEYLGKTYLNNFNEYTSWDQMPCYIPKGNYKINLLKVDTVTKFQLLIKRL